MVDIMQAFDMALTIIGGVVVILGVISPFTKNTWDDKILLALKGMSSKVKVNKEEGTVLIQVK